MNMHERITPLQTFPFEPAGGHQYLPPPNFGLRDVIRFLKIHRKVIAATAILVVALVAVVVLQMAPVYTATATVMLDERKNNLEDAAAVLSGLPSAPSTIENQIQILTSYELANRVVDKLKLDRDPEFNPKSSRVTIRDLLSPARWLPSKAKTEAEAQGMDPERSEVIARLLGHIDVSPIGLSTAMKISVNDADPAKAAHIANAVADAYVEDQLAIKYQATQKATQWLTARIAQLSRQAQAADAAVQQYKAANDITTTANGVSVIGQQIADINSQLVTARADLAEKRANYQHLVALARQGQAANAAQVLASPLISALRTQQTQLTSELANLSTKYGPRHPKILDLQAQIATLDAKIGEEVQRVVDSTKNEVDVASSHVASLEQSLEHAESQDAGQNQAAVRLTALQSTAASARAMYEAFLARLNQTEGQESIETPDARVITKASVPQLPSAPKKLRALAISLPVGLFLGLLLALVLDRLESGFRTTVEVESLLGLPVLATIPERRGDARGRPAELVMKKPMSQYSEAIRGLHLGLALSNGDRSPGVVAVTSALPGEGKSTVVVSLARAAARSGLRTVIIDGDLRHAQIGKLLDQRGAKFGLREALGGEAPLDSCLVKDKLSDAWALVCPQTPSNPTDVLSSQAMRELIINLRKVFDLVLVDSPPMLPVNDAKVIGRLADTVLLVVRWEKTPRDAVLSTVRSLREIGASVMGVAFTRADDERFRYYSYGYRDYAGYDSYYSN